MFTTRFGITAVAAKASAIAISPATAFSSVYKTSNFITPKNSNKEQIP